MDLKKKNIVKLESLRDEHARLIADNVRLTEEAAALRERYMAMQAQASMLTRDKAELTAKVESQAAAMDAMSSGASAATAATAATDAELARLRATVAELHAQMESAKVRRDGGDGSAPWTHQITGMLLHTHTHTHTTHGPGAQTTALAATKEREATINTSKPFLMLKQMLTKKNAQLAELRAAIRKYEPEKEEGAEA